MPFKSVSELPENIRKLSAKKQRQWMEVFNDAFERYDPKKDRGHDPKKTAAQNKESFAFRVANSVVLGSRKEELGTLFGPDVPIASMWGRGVLPWGLVEAFHGPGVDKHRKKRKRIGAAMAEVLQGNGSVAAVVEAALDEALHDHTFSEITRAVSQAVRAKLNPTGNMDVYVTEYFLGKVIVQKDGKLFEIEYTLDDETGEATLGKAKEVRVRFVPVGTP